MDEPTPDDYQPRLRWYGHVWRYALMLVISVLVWSPAVDEQVDQVPLLFWVDVVLGVVSYVLVAYRRRWPVPIAIATVLMTPFSSIAAGPATLATVSLATRRRWWQVIGIGVLNLLGGFAYYWVQPMHDTDPWWLTATVSVAVCAAILAWGMFIGSRRELIWTLRQRAETAEAERDLRATQARSNERARIAREMHDVLAHRISQISMHAGALTYREDLSADEMRSSVTVIQAKAHEALRDLREVLGVLREVEGAGPLTGPQPTYGDLGVLVDDARAAGTAIEYDDQVVGELPDIVGRTVYRIVQEGITNATKHARAATLRVTLSGSPADGVDVVLRNALGFGPTRTPGAGLGLVGLTERAELRGGWLTYGIEHSADPATPETFVLHAWLPWAAEQEEIPS
ncbi:histidine kinase [Pimelobacter simplex]|uniref:histidine kinase n=1 Tax=Nocardioides simplex TaxID=2045 RepID=A0A0A1DJB3_NOCSI|nr:histidine kinase [Pimelobacter simplex]AIY16757.1 putative two-component system sensor kinase [Pimelobacter simplex]MCG8154215.1 histidine kinase [Pimelobacter simplex]GEB15624.1 two-component sensor histidine kinase [Pimelobacter simplex]SFM57437.1 Signal transduction histidine kinase [Pimelobacter simplex]